MELDHVFTDGEVEDLVHIIYGGGVVLIASEILSGGVSKINYDFPISCKSVPFLLSTCP